MRQLALAFAALTLTGAPLHARELPPEPPQPDWGAAADAIMDAMQRSFIDPESINIEWVSGFAWGYQKPLIGRRTHGWVTCGNVNARNRMGGYVGSQGFVAVYTPEGAVRLVIGPASVEGTDTCYRDKVPVNPELIAASAKPGEAPAISIADEIAKLADLRERGLITDEEFAELKVKLLAQ